MNLEWEIQYAIIKFLENEGQLAQNKGKLKEVMTMGDGGYYKYSGLIDTRMMAQDVAAALRLESKQPIRNWLKIHCMKIIRPLYNWSAS